MVFQSSCFRIKLRQWQTILLNVIPCGDQSTVSLTSPSRSN